MIIKGYVVRGIGRFSGRTLYCAPFMDDGEVQFTSGRQHAEHATLSAAIGAERHAHASCRDVVILAVAEDGAEAVLPSYEEALAEVLRLTGALETARDAVEDLISVVLRAAAFAEGKDGARDELEAAIKRASTGRGLMAAIERLRQRPPSQAEPTTART